jgi:hypothetical protein
VAPEDAVGRRWVRAGALAVLVVALCASPFVDLALPVDFVGTDEFWKRVERLSWLATLAALGFAGVELKRVADELTRRPEIVVGFLWDPSGHVAWDEDVPIEVTFPTEPGAPGTGDLPITFANRGSRTAVELHWNFVFDPGVVPLQMRDQDGVLVEHGDGTHRLEAGCDNLHPGAVYTSVVSLEVPRGLERFRVAVVVTRLDALMQTFHLTAVVHPASAASVAPHRSVEGAPDGRPA